MQGSSATRDAVSSVLDAATRTFIEVSEDGKRVGTMNTDEFVREVSRLSGKRVAFVAEAVDVYNAQKKGERMTARMVVEKNVRGKWEPVGRIMDAAKPDYAANLALFLTEKKGRATAKWEGKMTAAEQRVLFGQVLGKGTIEIDGTEETVAMGVKTGFGADYDIVKTVKWRNL